MIRLDDKPAGLRATLSPAAYAVHSILSTSAKRGLSSGQEHVLRNCAKVLSQHDLGELRKLGHAEALDRHLRVQASLTEAEGGGAAGPDLERRKELSREAVADYLAGEGR